MGESSVLGTLTAITLGVLTSVTLQGLWQYAHRRRHRAPVPVTSDVTGSDTGGNVMVHVTKGDHGEVDYDDLWNTALFFPSPRGDDPTTSLNRLLFYLDQAQESLKLCIMTLTFDPVYDLLVNKHRSGVLVLVYTSFQTANGKGKKLKNKGIPVRCRPKSAYSTEMHNKYVIVDERAILTGSMNWTAESIYKQRENILLTTHSLIVPRYLTHFDLMWANFWDENVDIEGNRLDTP